MKAVTSWIVAVALGLASQPARAEEPAPKASTRPAVEAFLLTGDAERNPGDPGTAKLVTVLSLYSLSAASLAAGTVFGFQALAAKSDADDFRSAQPRGFCTNPMTEACVRYEEMRADQNGNARSSGLFIGLGALLFVGGAATAQLWSNETLETVAIVPNVSPEHATITLRAPL